MIISYIINNDSVSDNNKSSGVGITNYNGSGKEKIVQLKKRG